MVTTYETDYYNFNHRTSRNTDLEDYNCGGYALGTFNWYLPMSDLSETTWRLVEDRKMSVDEIAQYYADYWKAVKDLYLDLLLDAGYSKDEANIIAKNKLGYDNYGKELITKYLENDGYTEEEIEHALETIDKK